MFKETERNIIKEMKRRSRSIIAMEFIKWFFLSCGIMGFLGWFADFLYEPSLFYGLYTYQIENIPIVCIIFAGILILSGVIATLQRANMIHIFQFQYDEMTNNLSKTLSTLNVTAEKLSEEIRRTNQLRADLTKSRTSISQLSSDIKKVTQERNKLDAKLKTIEKKLVRALSPKVIEIKGIGPKITHKLERLGIVKTVDLLTLSPEELAEKIDVSTNMVVRWLEQVTELD